MTTEVTDAELGITNAEVPRGAVLFTDDDVAKKGQIFIGYNENIDLWHVKRVVRASRPQNRYGGKISQADIVLVSHDAVPEEGKDGTAYSHYPSGGGYSVSSHSSLDNGTWYVLDLNVTGARNWVTLQDELWAQHRASKEASEAAAEDTPKKFSRRMNNRALQLENEASSLEATARQFRKLAADIRNESPGSWVK